MFGDRIMKDAWYLASHELKNKWLVHLGSILLYGYCGLALNTMVGPLTAALDSRAASVFLALASNFFILTVVSSLGFSFTKEYMSYWKTDAFTKRLFFLKTMAVSNRVIIYSRFLQILIMVIVMSVAFYSCNYAILAIFGRTVPDLGDFVSLALTWMGYSIVMGSLCVYWELGVHGKAYLLRSLILLPVYAISAYLLWIAAAGRPIWIVTMEWVRHYGLLIPMISLLLAAAAVYVSGHMLAKRLNQRDLHG